MNGNISGLFPSLDFEPACCESGEAPSNSGGAGGGRRKWCGLHTEETVQIMINRVRIESERLVQPASCARSRSYSFVSGLESLSLH